MAPYALKLKWFADRGYYPHYYQLIFHCMTNNDRLCRFRNLVAGRRGGKTLSAAWDCLYYMLNPEAWWWDFHRKEQADPLYNWALAKDHPTGLASLEMMRDVCRESGLQHNVDYTEHQGNRWFRFANGAFLHFRTAEDPQSLRGAGLHQLWMDEAGFIPDERAYEVARPALADKIGSVTCTTTPTIGKNWYYYEFFSDTARADPNVGSIEYRSIDCPYFSEEEWKYLQARYHPLAFKREFMASFESMAGVELSGDWLYFYTPEELPRSESDPDVYDLDVYIGVDPAISLANTADSFAIAAIGVKKDFSTAYLLDLWKGRIPFPEQVDKIEAWHRKWRPVYIGIEKTAYQAALAQQAARLSTLPAIIDVAAKGKKSERILSMSPSFRVKKVLIRVEHKDFIEEWLSYDSTLRNPHDDCLDAVEICLRLAGFLLPESPTAYEVEDHGWSLEEIAKDRIATLKEKDKVNYDPYMGSEY